jgi:hypothetical protein
MDFLVTLGRKDLKDIATAGLGTIYDKTRHSKSVGLAKRD